MISDSMKKLYSVATRQHSAYERLGPWPPHGRTLDALQVEQLMEIMEECGRAMYDDWEFRGSSASEVAAGLNAVAEILGLPGPTMVYDHLCEGNVE